MSDAEEQSVSPSPIWYLVVLVAAGLSSAAIALFVKGGIGDIDKLEERKRQLKKAKKQRHEELRQLRQREKRLHRDPHLIERLARQKLGLRRPGEKKIRFEDGSDTGVSLQSPLNENSPIGSLSIESNK